MSFLDLEFLAGREIPHPRPRMALLAGAGDEFARLGVDCHRGDLVVEGEGLERRVADAGALKDVDGRAGGAGEEAGVGGGEGGERVEVEAADGGGGGIGVDGLLGGAEVEPADGFVLVGRGGHEVVVRVPDDGFNGCGVGAGADFESGRGGGFSGLGDGVIVSGPVRVCGGSGRWVGEGRVFGALFEVPNSKFLFGTGGGNDRWRVLTGKADCADDVVVCKAVEAFAGMGVPNLT